MDNNEKKKIQSVQLKLQNGQVDIILRALELYKYNLNEIASLDVKIIEDIIKPLGSYHKKALYIKEISKILLTKYNGIVPNNRKELELMPGVGRKTTNVVLSELFDIPTMAVDTHVERVSKRLGLANKNDDVLKIEKKLSKIFDKSEYNKINHQLLLFGRYYCKAKNPICQNCKMECKYKKTRKI